jgi:phosphoglycolate phosphatase
MSPHTKPYRLIIFDFDGTLADSERCITASMSAALAECGRAADWTRLRSHIGLPLDRTIRGIVSQDLDDDQVEEIVRSYRRHHAVLQDRLIELYPGTLDTLKQLSASGVVLAIASSKITSAVEAALTYFDIGRFFACVVGGEQVANGKPAPDMVERILKITERPREEALVVGDTTFDVEMAHNAGVDSCAVTYGNQTREQLAQARPSYLAESIREVAGIVERTVERRQSAAETRPLIVGSD